MIPSLIVRELLMSGVRFSYESYDHKKAVAEMETLSNQIPPAASSTAMGFQQVKSSWGVPDEIKKHHIVWRNGRVSEVHFRPNGDVERVKIGKYYFKTFFLSDFGVRVKPILFKTEDKYDLIKQGLAVENNI